MDLPRLEPKLEQLVECPHVATPEATNNPTTVPTWIGEAKVFDSYEFDVLMYIRMARNQAIIASLFARLISGRTGRAREYLWMAGDLDRFAVDGGLEQKWVFVDHRKRE